MASGAELAIKEASDSGAFMGGSKNFVSAWRLNLC